jgi:L-cysteine S-thiosulfotransferase
MRLLIALLASIGLLQGCAQDAANSPTGFRLPTGNVEAGRKAFVDLRCYVCHQVKGVDAKFEGTPAASVALGGPVTRVKSYGELVTSIINPSHKIATGYPAKDVAPGGASLMTLAGLNDVMTVTQLVDLVAFLQPQYRVVPPTYDPYTYRYHYYYH